MEERSDHLPAERVAVTITAGDNEIEAMLRDGDLVFAPGAYSCCKKTEAVFERE